MRTIHSSNLILISSFNVKIAVNILEAEVAFTLVTNKKYKRRSKAFSLYSIFFSNFKSKILFISQILSLIKTVTTYAVSKSVTTYLSSTMTSSLVMITSKIIKFQIVSSSVLLASKSKLRSNHLLRLQNPVLFSKIQGLFLYYFIRTFYACYNLRRCFLTFFKL